MCGVLGPGLGVVGLLPGGRHQAFEARNAGPHNLVMPELVTGEL
jgi:hypothetical protein